MAPRRLPLPGYEQPHESIPQSLEMPNPFQMASFADFETGHLNRPNRSTKIGPRYPDDPRLKPPSPKVTDRQHIARRGSPAAPEARKGPSTQEPARQGP